MQYERGDKMERINNKKLKFLRESENLTQQEVSSLLGISVRTYQCYEQGTRKPPLDKAKKISDLFLCSVDDIFFDNEHCNMQCEGNSSA